MSGDITLHMPGKVERFGIRTHGLVKCPITIENGTELCYLRDYTLTTRNGKTIPMPYTAAEKDLAYPPQLCPRPFLYQHPLAQNAIEDAEGNDWSGYVILYQFRRNNIGYLNGYTAAFTPDDNSQGVLFKDEFAYGKPLVVGGSYQAGGSIAPIASNAFQLAYISKDGRYRFKSVMPQFQEIDFERYGSFYNTYYAVGYNLSGNAYSGITATSVNIPDATYVFDQITENEAVTGYYRNIYRISSNTAGNRFDYGGGCTSVTDTFPLWEYGPQIPNKTVTSSGKSKLPIDAYVDASGNPVYVYCSYDYNSRNSVKYRTEIVKDDVSWGADCSDYGAGVAGGKIISRDWELSESRKVSKSISHTVKIEQLGNSSALHCNWERNIDDVFTQSFSGDSGNRDDVSYVETVSMNSINLSVTLDNSTIYSFSTTAINENLYRVGTEFSKFYTPIFDLPEAFGSYIANKMIFRASYLDVVSVKTGREDFIVEVCVGTVLLAEGIHAFCVFITSGKSSERNNLNLMSQRFIISRIYGFGQSKAGFEVPKEDWDKKMYAAYDPVTKKISDIYHHPVFYQ